MSDLPLEKRMEYHLNALNFYWGFEQIPSLECYLAFNQAALLVAQPGSRLSENRMRMFLGLMALGGCPHDIIRQVEQYDPAIHASDMDESKIRLLTLLMSQLLMGLIPGDSILVLGYLFQTCIAVLLPDGYNSEEREAMRFVAQILGMPISKLEELEVLTLAEHAARQARIAAVGAVNWSSAPLNSGQDSARSPAPFGIQNPSTSAPSGSIADRGGKCSVGAANDALSAPLCVSEPTSSCEMSRLTGCSPKRRPCEEGRMSLHDDEGTTGLSRSQASSI